MFVRCEQKECYSIWCIFTIFSSNHSKETTPNLQNFQCSRALEKLKHFWKKEFGFKAQRTCLKVEDRIVSSFSASVKHCRIYHQAVEFESAHGIKSSIVQFWFSIKLHLTNVKISYVPEIHSFWAISRLVNFARFLT